MPEPLRTVLNADPTRDDWSGFTAAMAFADAGFRVLPVVPGGKAPISTGPFQHGARSATTDRESVRDAFVNNPGANVAVAPVGGYVVLDVDPRNGGSLEAAERFGLPIGGYRERSGGGGWHIPLTLPSGARAERSAILAPGVEIKAAGSYVVSPHSRIDGAGWYRPDPDRDVWQWGQISVSWPYLDHLVRQETAIPVLGTITNAHRRAARRVIDGLMAAPADIARDSRLLLAGIIPPDASESECDYRLALLASFHTQSPNVIAAVLDASELKRPKWRAHETYLAGTIGKALARRQELATNRSCLVPHTGIDAIRAMISAGNDLLAGLSTDPSTPTCELLLHFGLEGCRNRATSPLLAFLLGVRETGPDSPFARADDWMRVPVLDLAKLLDFQRTTIHRALEKLVSAGIVERQTVVSRVNGSARRDSLVRFVAGMDSIP